MINLKNKLMSIDYSDFSNYTLKDTIGEGNFGKVKLAIFNPTGEEFAVKVLNKKKIKEKMNNVFFNENEIIKKFNHINVIYVYQLIEQSENYYIVMEYCSKGELFDYIVNHKRLSEEEASIFFYQLINGLEHIHKKKVAHRDLKPENLLLTKNNILKIIDFGLSHIITNNNLLSTKCGSPSYASPEIITRKYYDGFKTDIWCCGIILFAMLCGYLPFEGESNDELFKNILIGKPEFPKFLSVKSKKLISQLLNINPEERIYIDEIKKDDFYLKGKSLSNIDYDTIEKSIINTRKMIKNKDIKKKIKNFKKEKDKNGTKLNKKIQILNNHFNFHTKNFKQLNNILQTDSISVRNRNFSLNNHSNPNNTNITNNNSNTNANINIITRNKKRNHVFSATSIKKTKNKIKTLTKGFFREFTPKYTLKELIEFKKSKKNIPFLNNSNFVYNNVNLNINQFYFNEGNKNKNKSIKTTLGPFEHKLYLSKKNKLKKSFSNNTSRINNNSSSKKSLHLFMNNLTTNFKIGHRKKGSINGSVISNISNYTNPNSSNIHSKSSSKDDKYISKSTRRELFNQFKFIKHHF